MAFWMWSRFSAWSRTTEAGGFDAFLGPSGAAARRRAVQEDRVGPGPPHQLRVHLVGLKDLPPRFRFLLLAHAGPDVGVDAVGAGDRFGRVLGQQKLAAFAAHARD